MPSKPSLQAWRNATSPGSSMCSFKCSAQSALRRSLASSRLRSSSGARRRSHSVFEDEVVLLHRGGTLPCRDGLYSCRWERISNPNPKFPQRVLHSLRGTA
jgi:hypothetical protein